jgi:hypothetical protein
MELMEHIPDHSKSQYLNLGPYTEFDLADGFAEQYGNHLAYVAAQKQWYWRSFDNDGQPCWAPDELSMVFHCIRLFLREVYQNLTTGRQNRNLCTAAAVRAVEELARSDLHFAITEADLEPGELAKSDAARAKIMECFRQAPPPPNPAQSTAAPQATPKARPRARALKPKPTNPANPAPKVDNPQTTTTPRSLMDDMARWAAVRSTS